MIERIRKARQRVAELYAKSDAAQPGEIWTTRYAGPDFKGNHFESYIAGEVRILGEECPVVEYRGAKTLGEDSLDMELVRPWRWIQRLFLIGEALQGRERSLEPGDTAPDLTASADVFSTAHGTAGDYLGILPNGKWVSVEYRNPHPSCARQRMVVVGTTYDHDIRDDQHGRDVGGDWVPFEQVTAVYVHPSLVDGLFEGDEVAS